MINVDELLIEHVTQEYFNNKSIDIDFDLLTGQFQLHVRQDEKGVFRPFEMYHSSTFDECSYCDGSRWSCTGLSLYKNEFFHRLIEFPSIRLEWLFINHV